MSTKMNDIIQKCPGIGRKIFVFKDRKRYTAFITLNGRTEPVPYVKPSTKYDTVDNDIVGDEPNADISNNTSLVFSEEFSIRLNELIRETDIPTDDLYETDYFDSDDEIEVDESLYDP
jgi:hypothetical protein